MVEGGSDNTPQKPKAEHNEAPEERIKHADPIEAASIMLHHIFGGGVNKVTDDIAKRGTGDVRASSDLSGNVTEYSKSGEIAAIRDKHGNNLLDAERDLPSTSEKTVEKSAYTISSDGNTITAPGNKVWYKVGTLKDGRQQWQNGVGDDFNMIWNGHANVVDGKLITDDKDCPMTRNPFKPIKPNG